MSTVKSLIDTSITLQGAALLGENARVASQALDFSKRKRRSSGADLKDITGLGVKNLVGIGLLRANSELASGL